MPRAKSIRGIHPGEILRDELAERGISLNRLSRETRIPLSRVSLIANGRRAITAETALRLARYFQTSPEMWMNLQSRYDLDIASTATSRIEREVIPAA